MKIFGIGLNYHDHIVEFGGKVPTSPVVFTKPDTALLKDNAPFYFPPFTKDIHFEAELVLKVSKEGKFIDPKFAHKYVEEIGVGIDFTARDLQLQLKANGHPWDIAKGFNGSAPVSEFVPLLSFPDMRNISFGLRQNGQVKQSGNSKNMIFDFWQIISFLSTFFTLKKGDLVFTGTPVGVGSISIGDQLEVFLEDKKMIEMEIK